MQPYCLKCLTRIIEEEKSKNPPPKKIQKFQKYTDGPFNNPSAMRVLQICLLETASHLFPRVLKCESYLCMCTVTLCPLKQKDTQPLLRSQLLGFSTLGVALATAHMNNGQAMKTTAYAYTRTHRNVTGNAKKGFKILKILKKNLKILKKV